MPWRFIMIVNAVTNMKNSGSHSTDSSHLNDAIHHCLMSLAGWYQAFLGYLIAVQTYESITAKTVCTQDANLLLYLKFLTDRKIRHLTTRLDQLNFEIGQTAYHRIQFHNARLTRFLAAITNDAPMRSTSFYSKEPIKSMIFPPSFPALRNRIPYDAVGARNTSSRPAPPHLHLPTPKTVRTSRKRIRTRKHL